MNISYMKTPALRFRKVLQAETMRGNKVFPLIHKKTPTLKYQILLILYLSQLDFADHLYAID